MNRKLSVFVMSMTIWDQHGQLDEGAFRQHLGRIKDGGASTYIGSSGTGDGFAMSTQEWERVLAIAADEFKGRGGFRVMGYEPRTLADVERFLKLVEPHRPEAVQVYPLDLGHAVRPTNGELEAYYSTILGGTDLQIVLSSFDTLGFQLPLDLIEKLADRFPNLLGFVYGGRDPVYLTQSVYRLRDRLEIHCAGPSNAVTLLTLGGNGFMGHEGNLSPALVAGVIRAFAAGDMAALHANYAKLMQVFAMHLPHGGSAGRSTKPLLNAFGLPGGSLRTPRTPVTADVLAELVQATLKLDLPGFPKQPV